MSYSYATLPGNDNINRFSYCIEVKNHIFIQKGKMIAYYGALRFEDIGGLYDNLLKEAFNSPLYVFDYIAVSGNGKLILADNYNDINSVFIEGQSVTILKDNLLGFEPALELQESIMAGYVTLKGTGAFIMSTNGPAHLLKPPVKVDPDALIGWIDLPSPSFFYDMGLKNLFGLNSGEEKQVDFYGSEEGTVIIQCSENWLNFGPDQLT